MPSYNSLKKQQTSLIRKALQGSVFVADATAAAIANLTASNAALAATRVGNAAADSIGTAGNLVLKMDAAANDNVALLAADTPASVVTKINTAISTRGTASLVNGVLQVVSSTTGAASRVEVVSGTGSVLANLKHTVGASVGSAAMVDLLALPAGYEDLGYLSSDGAQFSRDVSSSDVTSWGSVAPTRSDITSDTSTLSVTAQETKLITLNVATGSSLLSTSDNAVTGEVSMSKPARPASKFYRVLSIAVDSGDLGDIYVARFFPRAKVSSFAEQSFSAGDDPISWGVTFTAFEDSNLGYSERWLFGGPGWSGLMTEMGF